MLKNETVSGLRGGILNSVTVPRVNESGEPDTQKNNSFEEAAIHRSGTLTPGPIKMYPPIEKTPEEIAEESKKAIERSTEHYLSAIGHSTEK